MSGTRKPIRWAVVAIIVVALAGLAVHRMRGPAVPVLLAESKPLVHRVVASGRVAPASRMHLGSTSIGKAVSVHVQEGSRVKAGQLLVQLDDAEAVAAVSQARGAVHQAEARLRLVRQVTSRLAAESATQAATNLEQAERQFRRIDALAQSGAVPQEQLDDARRGFDNARSQQQSAAAQLQATGPGGSEFLISAASVSQAQAALLGASARLDQTRIHAPADGVVLARSVEPGDVVQPGKVLLVLAREGETHLEVTPDEKNLAYLRIGQTALASADAFPEQRFQATVSYIAPAVDPDRGTVLLKLTVDKPPEYLRADMTVSVDIEVDRRESALVLPTEAVRDPTGDRPWVMLVEGSRAVKRPVKVGIRGEGLLEIVEGLQPGDRVVPPSAGPLMAGSRVRPKAAEPGGAGAL